MLQKASPGSDLRLAIYVIINDKVERDFQLVDNKTADIAARASASVTKTQVRSILQETYDFTRRNRFGFNLTYIDKDIPKSSSLGFQTEYMRGLYQYGFEKAQTPGFWSMRLRPTAACHPPAFVPLQKCKVSRGRTARRTCRWRRRLPPAHLCARESNQAG